MTGINTYERYGLLDATNGISLSAHESIEKLLDRAVYLYLCKHDARDSPEFFDAWAAGIRKTIVEEANLSRNGIVRTRDEHD